MENNNNNNNIFNFFWNQEHEQQTTEQQQQPTDQQQQQPTDQQQQPTDEQLYVSRFLDQIYITKTTQNNNNNQNKLVKKLTLDHLQSNLKHIKTTSSCTAQEEEDLQLINQLLQLNHYDIIPLTHKQLEALIRIDQYHFHIFPQQPASFQPCILDKANQPENQNASTSSSPPPPPPSSSSSSPTPPIKVPTTSTASQDSSQATSSPHLPTASSSSCTSSPISSATIFQKNQILDWYHSNGKNQTKTAKHFQTIYPSLRIKQPLISAWLKNEGSIRAKKEYVNCNVKRMRMIMYPKVDEKLGDWAHESMRQGRHVSDHLLREKWKELARAEKIPAEDWLHLSHGWLSSFKARKGLKQVAARRPSHCSSSSTSDQAITTTTTTTTTTTSSSSGSSGHMALCSDSSSTLCPDLHVISSPKLSIIPIRPSSVPGAEPPPQAVAAGPTALAPPGLLGPDPRPDAAGPAHLLPIVRPATSSSPYPASLSPSDSSPGSSPTPSIAQALHSIQLLLAYLPATTTISSHETNLTRLLIDHLAAYHLLLLSKIHPS